MSNLQLVKSANFGGIQCDIYSNQQETFMTREQVGGALGYADPIRAIAKLHERHPERLNQYSAVVKLTTTDGKAYNTTVYSRKGVMEICRHSNQPKADAFMDWVWDVMDGLITSKTAVVSMSEYQQMLAFTRSENIKVRKARELSKLAEKYQGQTFAQILDSYATKELTGEHLIPLPQVAAKTFTAAEIGEKLGITAHMVGRLANQHNLKTDQYGALFNDKAKYSNKEVQSFRYYEKVIPVLKSLLSGSQAS